MEQELYNSYSSCSEGTGETGTTPIIIKTSYLDLDGDVLLDAIRGKDPNTPVTIGGETRTAEDWYLLKFDGAVEVGKNDGAANAPFRPEDYDFPFAKNYQQYEEAYLWGGFAKGVVGVSAGVAEAGGLSKSAAPTSNPVKSQADYSGVYKQAYGGMSNTLKTSELNTTHSITMSNNKFKSFVDTIKNEGIKEPIKYVEYNGHKYVVDGHHRLQAAKQLGIKDVPAQKVELSHAGYKTVDDLFWGD